jgi:nitrogen fixation protein NifB
MFPNAGTPFENVPEPTPELMADVRSKVREVIPQMEHCTRCRADAVGLLDDDKTEEFRGCLSECSSVLPLQTDGRPHVAVATLEGMLVNQHLGEAHRFQIWTKADDGYELVDERPAPEPGAGATRWFQLADSLKDCRAILVAALGETPRQILMENNVVPVEMSGFIQLGLDAVYQGRDMSGLKGRRLGCGKGAGCSGDGGGCG